ncbi:ABC transporter ATP-binding protein [Oceanobacillus jordanicus]|uniref:ATP-binding cassette domain-containing protein n=1 Tax=Oceanobacillus jordanicus TaxID=2867266 RepID=A0AAW5BD88_9BACI|nr:oligopeptide/dipeptide ABC transporter ATP-binding protein [Oceanobacillus jordanicus]MCG3420918.1 ATP-binding cassette domain-containing protein [Oceanobacillus jordanicus]
MTQQVQVKQSTIKAPLLEVKELSKHFVVSTNLFGKPKESVKAVNEVNLLLEKGETLGIVGESGCGKSTMGNTILRLIEPTEGSIFFEGQDVLNMTRAQLQEMRKEVQMIFQDPFSSLNPRMRVFDIIAEPLRTHKVANGKELHRRVYELLDLVGLDQSQADRFPHQFSGGQRQRIGIARAIALNPKLIVCDEPVSALDVSIQAQILNLLLELKEKLQLTLIFIGHGIPAVKYISDRIAVMYLGEIVEMADKESLFSKTRHPYTQGLISAVPIPDPSLREVSEDVILEKDLPDQRNLPKGCSFYSRCPFATEKCKGEKPKLKANEEGHLVACHYPLHA